jgi:hypothetical protein
MFNIRTWTVYDWLWLGWLVYFAIVEGRALFNSKPGDTLSEHAWAWLGYDTRRHTSNLVFHGVAEIRRPSGWMRLRRFMLLAFLMWLVIHLLTGGVF